jgi:hypothetical protein
MGAGLLRKPQKGARALRVHAVEHDQVELIEAPQRTHEGMIETNDASLSPNESSSSPNDASFEDNVGQRLTCSVDRVTSEASIGPSEPRRFQSGSTIGSTEV